MVAHRYRVICPVCQESKSAMWATSGDPDLVLNSHAEPGPVPRDERGRPRPRRCAGSGQRVTPEQRPPVPRPISYEETRRAVEGLGIDPLAARLGARRLELVRS